MLFNGFEQILMAVIEQTAHTDENLTDEQRFDNALIALFGKRDQEKIYKKMPAEISLSEMLKIVRLCEEGMQKKDAMRNILMPRLKNDKTLKNEEEQITKFELLYERITTELKRHYNYYKYYDAANRYADVEQSPYYSDSEKKELIEQRKQIFDAIRNAGWF